MNIIEDYSSVIPARAGKIVGIASYRGDYIVVACEYGLFKLFDDGMGSINCGGLQEVEVQP